MVAKVSGISLARIQEVSQQRQAEFDPYDALGAEFFALELAGEAGETANKVKKLWRERLGVVGSRTNIQEIEEEIADVILSACNLANKLGINLALVVPDKFNATSDKLGFVTRL